MAMFGYSRRSVGGTALTQDVIDQLVTKVTTAVVEDVTTVGNPGFIKMAEAADETYALTNAQIEEVKTSVATLRTYLDSTVKSGLESSISSVAGDLLSLKAWLDDQLTPYLYAELNKRAHQTTVDVLRTDHENLRTWIDTVQQPQVATLQSLVTGLRTDHEGLRTWADTEMPKKAYVTDINAQMADVNSHITNVENNFTTFQTYFDDVYRPSLQPWLDGRYASLDDQIADKQFFMSQILAQKEDGVLLHAGIQGITDSVAPIQAYISSAMRYDWIYVGDPGATSAADVTTAQTQSGMTVGDHSDNFIHTCTVSNIQSGSDAQSRICTVEIHWFNTGAQYYPFFQLEDLKYTATDQTYSTDYSVPVIVRNSFTADSVKIQIKDEVRDPINLNWKTNLKLHCYFFKIYSQPTQ